MHFYILAAEPINIGGMVVLGIPVAIALLICWSLRGGYRTVALIPTTLLTLVYVGEWFAGGNLAGLATFFFMMIAYAVFVGIVIVQQIERTATKRKAGGGGPPAEGGG